MGRRRCAELRKWVGLRSRRSWQPRRSRICRRARSPAGASILFFRPRISPRRLYGLRGQGRVWPSPVGLRGDVVPAFAVEHAVDHLEEDAGALLLFFIERGDDGGEGVEFDGDHLGFALGFAFDGDRKSTRLYSSHLGI